jgi:hypothetical protein
MQYLLSARDVAAALLNYLEKAGIDFNKEHVRAFGQ